MPRLPHLMPDDLPPEHRAHFEALLRSRGFVPNLYTVMAHSPNAMAGFLDFTATLRSDGALPAADKELVILLVGHLTGAQTILDAHRGFARDVDLSEDLIEALPDYATSSAFDARQRALLAYTRAITEDIRVDDTTWDAVAAYLDNAQLAELTLVAAAYNMVARFLEPLQIDPDPRYQERPS